ncbi:MAG TPA: undecaprenyl-phosphate glucose phosphotransferase [Mobilitalea sp.]|nr:undecaprenyl-phosphate glucose phosphotransferase [Mobilitalea sp.]
MIKDNQKMLNRVHILMDACIIAIAFLVSYYFRFGSNMNVFFNEAEPGTYYPLSVYSKNLFFLIPLYLLIYSLSKLYAPKRGKTKWVDTYNIIIANILGIAFYTLILYMQGEKHISRGFMISFFITNVVLSSGARLLLAYSLRVARKKGYNMKHVILVGYSRSAEAYIDRIFANPQWGYYIHGILDDSMEVGTMYKKVPVVGSIEHLEDFLVRMALDEIAITLNIKEYAKLEAIVATCEKSGVHTKFIPDYYSFIPTKPYTEDLYGLPVVNIRNVPLSNTFNRLVKRLFDVLGAVFALLIFSIPMLLAALLIRLSSDGPVIFSQTRVGKQNKSFEMYKFRSMKLQQEGEEHKAWTISNDPRVTGIGKFIRRTSIDELPQLFNVLKGDMSLVGPRPERPFFVEKFKEEIPRYMIKHQVSPGLTGWAQINGYRGDTSIRKRIDHDLYYIENWTMGMDIKILFLTVFKGFINKNAY